MNDRKHYLTINEYLKSRFGQKLYRIALNGGMTCPNRDGKIGTRGCIFCSEGGSGEFAQSPKLSISEQIENGKTLLLKKQKSGKYIAYFQAYTNTYAPVEYLSSVFYEAALHPDIAVISIATRPDCIDDDIIVLLSEINKIKPVWIELGLQTSNEKSALFIRRGYDNSVFEQAVVKLRNASLDYIVHLIFGLPDETHNDMFDSVKYVSSFKPNGIKLQLLHIIKNTDLAQLYEQGLVNMLSMDEYIDIIVYAIGLLPPETVIHRLTGDSPHGLLIAPKWSEKKWEILNEINSRLELRNIFQGDFYKGN